MSRLLDRFLAAGCPPFKMSALYSSVEMRDALARACERIEPGVAEASGLGARGLAELILSKFDAEGTERLEPEDLKGLVVIAADNVADYCDDLATHTNIADVVTTVAPPFDRFFIECQPTLTAPRKGISPLHAWGFLCHGFDLARSGPARADLTPQERRLASVMAAMGIEHMEELSPEVDRTAVRWVLQLDAVLEPRKGRPIGPVARWQYFLDEDGCLIGTGDGSLVAVEGLVPLSGEPFMTDFEADLLALLDNQLLPALFAISLMHCRNVQVERRDPPAALSRKAQRRGGLPLTRYHVLEISAMRRVLDNEGRARSDGLGSALHICRGHFKTFTAEAPLFGKHVGRYFWHDVARGSPDRGVVTTDYKITTDAAE